MKGSPFDISIRCRHRPCIFSPRVSRSKHFTSRPCQTFNFAKSSIIRQTDDKCSKHQLRCNHATEEWKLNNGRIKLRRWSGASVRISSRTPWSGCRFSGDRIQDNSGSSALDLRVHVDGCGLQALPGDCRPSGSARGGQARTLLDGMCFASSQDYRYSLQQLLLHRGRLLMFLLCDSGRYSTNCFVRCFGHSSLQIVYDWPKPQACIGTRGLCSHVSRLCASYDSTAPPA